MDSMFLVNHLAIADARYNYDAIDKVNFVFVRQQVHDCMRHVFIMSEVVSSTSTGRSAGITFCRGTKSLVEHQTITAARYKDGTIAEVYAVIV